LYQASQLAPLRIGWQLLVIKRVDQFLDEHVLATRLVLEVRTRAINVRVKRRLRVVSPIAGDQDTADEDLCCVRLPRPKLTRRPL
jgi:hypothetical protein